VSGYVLGDLAFAAHGILFGTPVDLGPIHGLLHTVGAETILGVMLTTGARSVGAGLTDFFGPGIACHLFTLTIVIILDSEFQSIRYE
jgi:hypothetical protein